ncbi:XRE family transcriptional regulator [Nocardioides speluncae]|uniref:XRE family transcriptional regulator n=1 Tax=Nocardioides speluncae TaxID=2670337 RepID=UPI00197E761A|nr:XRE family transcriptional regulator [Nocardioides speluncae]
MSGRVDEPRTVLECLARRLHRTWEELAGDFVAVASSRGERATMSPRHFRRLAAGERAQCTPVTRRVLEAMFDRPFEELIAPYGADDSAALELARVAQPSASKSQEEMIAVAASRARLFGRKASESSLNDESIDQIHDDVRRLCMAYPQRPLADIVGDLVIVQETQFSLLERRQRPSHLQQLYFLTAITGGMLAKASHDMGDAHAAMTQARTAFLCADHADQNGLRAWIRGLQSLVTYWDGRPRESVRYAQQGAAIDPGRGTTSVWLAVSEARGQAALGNVSGSLGAIERGERGWDDVANDELDEFGGICMFSRARQLYYSADALALLPAESRRAEEYATQAVAAYSDEDRPEWAFGDQAGARTDLAIARINHGEPEGAAEAIAPVLEMPPARRIRGVVASARNVHKALVASDLAKPGAELQEQIEDFVRTPLAALPR